VASPRTIVLTFRWRAAAALRELKKLTKQGVQRKTRKSTRNIKSKKVRRRTNRKMLLPQAVPPTGVLMTKTLIMAHQAN